MGQIRLENVMVHEVSEQFLQGMLDRMAVGVRKYGTVKVSMEEKGFDAMAMAYDRMRLYSSTGNTEWLMDAANYLMMEFMFPQHKDAHFKATDSDESPGRILRDGTRTGHAHDDSIGGEL